MEKLFIIWQKVKELYYKYFCRHGGGRHIVVTNIFTTESHGNHVVEYTEKCKRCGKYRDYVYGYLTEWKTKKED